MNGLFLEYKDSAVKHVIIEMPPSKSVAARAAILSRIFDGAVILTHTPDCDDYRNLSAALDKFSKNGFDSCAEYDLGDGAAPLRFFLAYVASQPDSCCIVTCSPQLRKRPLAPLIEVLRKAGAEIVCTEKEGFPALKVKGANLSWAGGDIGGELSSQFASALLMASLIWERPFELPQHPEIVSRPYLEMTRKMIGDFEDITEFDHELYPVLYSIEGDWSAAGFFYEFVLLNPDYTLTLENLLPTGRSVQGDVKCVEIFSRIGVYTEFIDNSSVRIKADKELIESLAETGKSVNLDMGDTPDLVPAFVAGLCMAGINFKITGIGHLKYKESDRLTALAEELAKAGFELTVDDESLAWNGKRLDIKIPVCFDSHDDHRIAMAISVLASRIGPVFMRNAACVSKSYPDFFDVISCLGFAYRP